MTRIRPWKNFREDPSSLRYATMASVAIMVVLVFLGAAVMRILDSEEYPTYGEALWFALQTITTVGYGDNTPASATGRIVAAVVMLVSIALITVITAIITSLFVQSARDHRTSSRTDESLARIEASLALAQERLDRIERGSVPEASSSDGGT